MQTLWVVTERGWRHKPLFTKAL